MNKTTDAETDDDLVQKRACPFPDCSWEVEKKIITEMDEHDLDQRAERHYERDHVGRARTRVVLELEQPLRPGRTGHDLSDAAQERFEDERLPGGYEFAWAVTETLEEPTPAELPGDQQE